jgi:opacity protein-like surface antigen
MPSPNVHATKSFFGEGNGRLDMKRHLLVLSNLILLTLVCGFAQNVEITAHGGGVTNGGLDLSTTQFDRIDVDNGSIYGASLGYLFGEHSSAEFQWNHTHSDVTAERIGGGFSPKLFSLNQNQYMGNYLFHFSGRESKLRPFVLLGLGANHMTPSRAGVEGITRFAWAIGGGAKYNMSKHFGLRADLRYSPTYLTTTSGGYWCDPFWGGCWLTGNDHYLNSFHYTGGVTFRF